jgi:DNA-binding winged helix-turn-helix (wHTH) protein
LSRDGARVELRGQPYRILEVLLNRAGKLVTRDEFREKLWPGETFVDFEHGLNTSVKKLRMALGDSAEQPTYIETVRGFAYRFVPLVQIQVAEPRAPETMTAPVEPMTPVSDRGSPVEKPAPAGTSRKVRQGWVAAMIVTAAVLCAGGGVLSLPHA